MAVGASAQKHGKENHHKDYSSYLPKKGDLATGVDLVGMVKFVGNSISDKSEEDAIAPFDSGNFFAKYFVTDNIALRARLSLGVSNSTNRVFAPDYAARQADPNSDAEVVDTHKRKSNNFTLGLGVEFRRSMRRVQGYAGAEAFIGSGSSKDIYEYGNSLNTLRNYYGAGYNNNGRTLERPQKSLSGGLAIFTGVDYFISRNVSLGFEFSLAGVGTSIKPVSHTYEEWDGDTDKYKKTTEEMFPKQSQFRIAPSAGANLMFYF